MKTLRKKITVVGSGYVGAITGIGLANLGHIVEIVDIDANKIENWIQRDYPIFEQDLDYYYQEGIKNGLKFTTEISGDGEYYIIAVGTPKSINSDEADLSYVYKASHMIAQIAKPNSVAIMKSTVPVGTNSKLKSILSKINPSLSLVSNPEFLREGSAFSDFFEPDRIILGSDNLEAMERVAALYSGIDNQNRNRNQTPLVKMSFESAELVKHASNGFLAIKLSYVNEIAKLCSECGASSRDVLSGMGLDPRIGGNFMQSGPGWGGSCFPKDSLELCATSMNYGVKQKVLYAAIQANEDRKTWCSERAINVFKKHGVRKIGVFGLAFKANTDDVRESPALQIVKQLINSGFELVVTDEKATSNFQEAFPASIQTSNLESIFEQIDGAVVLTEWANYSVINWSYLIENEVIKCVVDFRNVSHTHNHPSIYRY